MSQPKPPESPPRLTKLWVYALLVGALVGLVTGRALPPPYPDGQWRGVFFTSGGFGGSLAVVGAGIAAGIAFYNSRSDRRQNALADDRGQWWDRFAWACDKSVSTTPGESEMGLSVLQALIDAPWAREEDNEMAIAVANVILNAMAPAHPSRKWWKR